MNSNLTTLCYIEKDDCYLDEWGCEYMHLYTADGFEGDGDTAQEKCTEGRRSYICQPQRCPLLTFELWYIVYRQQACK